MSETREVAEGLQYQGEDERVVYTIDTTLTGDDPTSPLLVVKDEASGNTDITSLVATGSASVVDNIISLPLIHSLTAEKYYRCEVKFTLGGNVLEHYFRILGEV